MKKILFATLICICSILIKAQAPTWSVNPNTFQYDMTYTAVLDLNCVELTNPSNQIGAFVNGVVRGEANTLNIINGRYVATMTVYSNQLSGETVEMRFYDVTTNAIYVANNVVTFQNNAIYGTPNSPEIVITNNAPSLLTLSADTLYENMVSGTTIGAFTTTDIDAGQTHSYSLVAGTGSTNNSLFSISGADLIANFSANFENKSSYSVRVKTTDSDGCFLESVFIIIIKDLNDAPTALALTNSQVDENQFSNTTIGTLSAIDTDANEILTFSLVAGSGGSDNGNFNINGTTLRTSSLFDYETKPQHSIRVQVSDRANNTYIDTFKINVNDINDSPTDVILTKDSVDENLALNTVIATLTTADQDAGQSHAYSFDNVAGNDNASFNIVGNTLRTKSVFDYETSNLYFIYIKTNDLNGGTYTKQLSIKITDANDVPTDIQISTLSANENMPIGSFVAKLLSTDQDINPTFSYSLVNGVGDADNGNFQISNDSLFTNAVLNINTKATHDIRLESNDGAGGTFSKNFTIVVKDINDVPTDINLSNNIIAENASVGTEIGTFTSIDPDAGDLHNYSLVSGAGDVGNLAFSISSDKLLSNATYNINTQSTYSIRVQSNDGFGGVFQKVFTVTIANANDNPTDLVLSNDSVYESLPPNVLIGSFSSVDPDVADIHTYSFVSGSNDNASFAIVGSQLRSSISYNFEAKSSYLINVQTSDGNGGTLNKQFDIGIKDTTDGPSDIAISNNQIAENSAVNSFIATLSSTDEDANDTFTYSLVSGLSSTNNASFTISNDSLYAINPFDYESKNEYEIRIRSTDASNLYTEKGFTINVTNANDLPTDINLDNSSINESASLNSSIGDFSTLDPDTGNTHTYQLVNGTGDTDNQDFTLFGATLKTNTVFDYNVKSSYTIRIRTTDNQNAFFEKAFTITVTDANDAPTDILLANDSIDENLPSNTLVTTISTVDPDAGDNHTYSLASGIIDNAYFAISGNELRTAQKFDFETKNSFFISIVTNDGKGGVYTKPLTISIKDANDKPTDLSLSNNSLEENLPLKSFIGTLNSVDEDATDNFTYSLVTGIGATNNALFEISNDSLYSNNSFNYEVKSSYSIRIRTTDKGSVFSEKAFSISITDGNDAPTDIIMSNQSVQENASLNSTVGTFTSIDPDAQNTFTYSLVAGVGSTDNGDFVINGSALETNTTFDINTKSAYTVRVKTTDGDGLSTEKAFAITISNSNDTPSDLLISSDSISENSALNTKVGSFSTVDSDVQDSHTYSFITGPNDNASFNIVGNELRTASSFDFENKSTYFVLIRTEDAAGASYTKQLTINVKDSTDSPSDIAINISNLVENLPINSFIGVLSTTDEDATDTFAYSFSTNSSPNNNSSFLISNDSLFSNQIFNYEQKKSYAIRIKSTDQSNLNVAKDLTILITDGNDTPTDILLNNSVIAENVPINTRVGDLSSIDPDTTDSYTYSLVAGTGDADNADFSINGVELRTSSLYDVNVKTAYAIRVRTTDNNGEIFEKAFTITIVNANDAPTNIVLATDSVAENLSSNSIVTTISTVDPDAADTHIYSLTAGVADNAFFAISGNELRTIQPFDFEMKSNYFISIETNDGKGGLFTKPLTIIIKDANDAPTDISINNNSIEENLATKTFIGVFSSVDVDAIDNFIYSLNTGIGATNNALFQISNDSLYSNNSFNFEVKDSYSIRVRTTDKDNGFTEKVFTINITDGNDAPTDINLSNQFVMESAPLNTSIGTFSTVDPDLQNTFTYEFVSGIGSADNGSFIINGSSLETNTIFNVNTKSIYSVRVKSTDGNGLIVEKAFTITITNSNDAPSNILISNDTITENSSINTSVGTLSTVDSDVPDSHSYSFVNGNNDNAVFNIVGNELRTAQGFNFEQRNKYFVLIRTEDLVGASFIKQLTINVKDSTDTPSDIDINISSLEENLSVRSFIGLLSTTDEDAADSFSYSFASNSSPNNNASFVISNDSLLSNSVFNYELKNSYNIRLKSTDQSNLSTEKDLVISIINGNDLPQNILLSNAIIAENLPINSTVGGLTTVDPDTVDSYTYSLVSGAGDSDNADFSINGSEIRTGILFDVNVKTVYSVRVRTTDLNGATFEKSFTIAIINANDTPSDILLSNDSIAENLSSNNTIGTFSTVDADAGDSHAYSLVSGASDNASFAIVGNELRTAQSFNFEQKSFYFITVQTDDGKGGIFSKQLNITIKDANDSPNDILLSNNEIIENNPSREFIGILSSLDEDASDSYSYSLVSGINSTNNSLFQIGSDSLFSNSSFDFEVKSSYSIRIRSTDNSGAFLEEVYTITVKDGNDSPTNLGLSNSLIAENSSLNTTVGLFSTTDPDIANNFMYTLVSGVGSDGNGAFSINGSELKTDTVFDVNLKNTYNIRVRTTDQGGLSFENTFVIRIENSNDNPTNIAISSDSIFENASINTLVGTLTSSDPDVTDTHSYSFVAGSNDNASFTISGNELRAVQMFNYELKNNYFITVLSNDGNGGTYTKQLTINIKDAPDAPTDSYLDNNVIQENQAIGTFIGVFITTDEDAVDNYTYSLVPGLNSSDNSSFSISNDSLFSAATFDYETKNTFSIRVRSVDAASLLFDKVFQIKVINGNDAPIDIQLSNNVILENVNLNSLVGNLTSLDPDTIDAHTYTLVSGLGDDDNDDFKVFGNQLKTDTVFDFNTKSTYSIRLRTTDNQGLTFEEVHTISILNANDAPTGIALNPSNVNENLAPNTLVGNFTSTDKDVNDSHIYSFANLSANDNASFAIVGSELRTSTTFDFETKPVYFIQIQSNDAAGASYSRQLIVNVNDTNDAPTDLSLSGNSVNEKQTTNQYIGRFNTTDADVADRFTYSLVNGLGDIDNGSFIISADSLFSTLPFDVLIKTQLSVRVETKDSTNIAFAKAFSIFVQDVNDAPTDITIDNASVPENTIINSNIGLLSTLDIDPMQTFTYSLVSGAGDDDNANFIINGNALKNNVSFDYNTQRLHSVRIRSIDQGGLQTEKVFAISITNSNDVPTDITLTPNSFNENLPQSSLIGLLETTDKDSTDTFIYSFVDVGTHNNSQFIILGNELRTASTFDYEAKDVYVISVETNDASGASFQRQLLVNVLDSNDAPVDVMISADSVLEKSVVGTFVADLSTLDEDATENFTYSLVSGQGAADNELFKINGNLLEVDSVLNFNNGSSRRIRIQSSDKGGRTIENSFVIRVINQNDLPTDIILSDTSINEIAPLGTRIAVISTEDLDLADNFTYSLARGTGDVDNVSFAIVNDELLTNEIYDFETKDSYSIRIKTLDSEGGEFEKVFVIALTNGNEKPVIEEQLFAIAENVPASTILGTIVASDMDANEVFSFKILGAQLGFSVDQVTGELSSNTVFNYEFASSYSLEVEVTDLGGLTDTASITIEILDQIEAVLPVSNLFTPNGDGKNDNWSIQNIDLYADYSLKIFTASGEVIYEISNNYNNDWDGTYSGSQLPEGIYYYYFESLTNSSDSFKGVITLKR